MLTFSAQIVTYWALTQPNVSGCLVLAICFSFIPGFIQFFFLPRSSTAHTDVNKALLWRLRGHQLLQWLCGQRDYCVTFKKPIQSHSMECGSHFIVCGFREKHMIDRLTLIKKKKKEQSDDPEKSTEMPIITLKMIISLQKHLKKIQLCSTCRDLLIVLTVSPLVQLLSVSFCTSVLGCCRL